MAWDRVSQSFFRQTRYSAGSMAQHKPQRGCAGVLALLLVACSGVKVRGCTAHAGCHVRRIMGQARQATSGAGGRWDVV